MKINLRDEFDDIETRYVKLDVFPAEKNNKYLLDVYLFLDLKSMQHYQVQLNNELRSKRDKIDMLIEQCAKNEEVEFLYSITPE